MSTNPELTKGNDLDNIFTARTTIEIDGVLYTLSNATITMPDGIDLTRSTYTQNDSTGYWINEDALEVYDATTIGYVEQGGSGPGIVDTITYKGASYKISLSADTSWMLQLSLDAFSDLDAAIASESFGVRAYTTVSPGIPIFRISTGDKKVYNNENRILTIADQITTDMIPDESITSDKLDWTTLTNLPIAYLSWTGPYAVKCELRRVANLVFFQIPDSRPSNGMPQSGTSDEVIPVGYRPAYDTNSPLVIASQNPGYWRVLTNGKCYWYFPGSNPWSLVTFVCYPTNDPWPD